MRVRRMLAGGALTALMSAAVMVGGGQAQADEYDGTTLREAVAWCAQTLGGADRHATVHEWITCLRQWIDPGAPD
jgi:hypothetical protein